jgi:hypothetical protein
MEEIHVTDATITAFGQKHIKVSIPKSIMLSDTEGKYTCFEVVINSSFQSWSVHKRYREFHALNSQLIPLIPKGSLCAFPKKKVIGSLQQTIVEERREALETYLQQVLQVPNALSHRAVVEFLEKGSGNLTLQLQMMEMKTQLTQTKAQYSQLQEQQRQSAAMIQFLTNKVRVLEKENPNDASEELFFVDIDTPTVNRTSSFSSEKKERGSGSSQGDTNAAGFSAELASPKPGYFIKQVLGLDKDIVTEDPVAAESGLLGGAFAQNDHAWPSISTTGDRSSMDSESTAKSLNLVEIINPSLLDFNSDLSVMDRLTDEIVTMVEPQEAQIQYRLSAARFLSKYTRKILGAQVYEIGLQGLRCFLPDDPIRLSVFLSRGTETGWHMRLNEQLCRLSGGLAEDIETVSTRKHQLSNVSFVSISEMTHKLQCLVDSVVGVEVLANLRLELCLMAFFEDFDRLFGKDHLFKRSLILIRAWWIYEANMSATCGISDSAFCVMILSILNRFEANIHHPFHALCYFLAQYSTLDFSKFVITIDGPLPVESFLTTGPRSDSRTSKKSTEYLHRYRKLTLAIDDEESSTMDLLNETIGDGTLSDASFVSSRINSSGSHAPTVCAFTQKPIMIAHPLLPGMIFDATIMQLRKKTSLMITDEIRAGAQAILPMLQCSASGTGHLKEHELSEKFFKNITARFGRGWRPDMPSTLLSTHPSNNSLSSLEPQLPLRRGLSGSSHDFQQMRSRSSEHRLSGDSMASVDTAAYKTMYAEDLELGTDIYWISLDKLWERIRYCNLLLESQISESGLRTLSRQVLEEKEPLPVGEIGKMLQEACQGISNMSSVLKERFGGLKKFLESYPDDFVLAKDHQFNPNVYLCDSLSVEELKMVMRGEPLNRTSQWPSLKAKKLPRGPKPNPSSSANRLSGGKKKMTSPSVTMQSPELGSAGGHYRTFSNDSSLNKPRRPSFPSPGGRALAGQFMGLNASSESPLPPRHNAMEGLGDHRLRAQSGSILPESAGLFSTNSLGALGMPDPLAPEFVPTTLGAGSRFGDM